MSCSFADSKRGQFLPHVGTWRLAALLAVGATLWAPLPPTAAQETDAAVVDLVVELLNDSDREIRALALEQIRTEARGAAATRRFAAQLARLGPEQQQALVAALAARGDAAAKPAIAELLQSAGDAAVRVAAVQALGSLGDADDCAALVAMLPQESADLRSAARTALIGLRGSAATDALTALFDPADAATGVPLIDILTERRALAALDKLTAAAVADDASLRAAAMTALGKLATPDQIAGMVRGTLRAESATERAAAEKAIMLACQRVEDPARRADALLAAIDALEPSDQLQLLSAVGRVGGPRALERVAAAIDSDDPQTHAAGVRALANWPDAAAAERLIALVRQDAHPDHQTAALRALIRIAPLPDGRTDAAKLELLQTAMALCTRDEDRSYALQRASAIRLVETLRWALTYLEQPAYAQQACETIVELAHHRGLREPHKEEFTAALNRVLETSKDEVVRDRAQRYLNNQTWVRPKKS